MKMMARTSKSSESASINSQVKIKRLQKYGQAYFIQIPLGWVLANNWGLDTVFVVRTDFYKKRVIVEEANAEFKAKARPRQSNVIKIQDEDIDKP